MKMEFSREDTKVIKGVAIVWMLIHHLWPFEDIKSPSRYINMDGYNLFETNCSRNRF